MRLNDGDDFYSLVVHPMTGRVRVTAAGAASAGMGLLTERASALAEGGFDNDRGEGLTRGDAALLRFAAAAEELAGKADVLAAAAVVAAAGMIMLALEDELDLNKAAEERERVIKALEYLDQQGLVELKVADVRQRFNKLQENDLPNVGASDEDNDEDMNMDEDDSGRAVEQVNFCPHSIWMLGTLV